MADTYGENGGVERRTNWRLRDLINDLQAGVRENRVAIEQVAGRVAELAAEIEAVKRRIAVHGTSQSTLRRLLRQPMALCNTERYCKAPAARAAWAGTADNTEESGVLSHLMQRSAK
jgi:hypothetical protein